MFYAVLDATHTQDGSTWRRDSPELLVRNRGAVGKSGSRGATVLDPTDVPHFVSKKVVEIIKRDRPNRDPRAYR